MVGPARRAHHRQALGVERRNQLFDRPFRQPGVSAVAGRRALQESGPGGSGAVSGEVLRRGTMTYRAAFSVALGIPFRVLQDEHTGRGALDQAASHGDLASVGFAAFARAVWRLAVRRLINKDCGHVQPTAQHTPMPVATDVIGSLLRERNPGTSE